MLAAILHHLQLLSALEWTSGLTSDPTLSKFFIVGMRYASSPCLPLPSQSSAGGTAHLNLVPLKVSPCSEGDFLVTIAHQGIAICFMLTVRHVTDAIELC